MNLPNKLTVLRMLLIPLFLLVMYLPDFIFQYGLACLVFAAASFTDFLDGYIARKHNLITDFGKLMDPLADKLLVLAAMVCFVELNWTSGLAVFVILAREFLVTSVRLVAAGKGTVLAADIWGKLKTVFQMVWIIYGLVLLQWLEISEMPPQEAYIVYMVLLCLVILLTVLSGANYVWKNRKLFVDR